MKKLLALILIIALAMPAAAGASASPALGMTLREFVTSYNSVQAPIGAPYVPLKEPYQWTDFNGYKVAFFYPTASTDILLLLMTKETESMDSSLDAVQIFSSKTEQLIAQISITARCVDLFSDDLFGNSLSYIPVTNCIRYYYESNAEKQGMSTYVSIDSDQKYALTLMRDSYGYTFQISTVEDVQ